MLGWTLDAFDYFLLVFVLKDVAHEFNVPIAHVTFAILLTLAARPVGAFLFGRAADRYGRRPTLMVDIVLYSVIEFACGFAPSLSALLVLRTLFGVAMGGEWGVGASLTLESVPARSRGVVSGLLQAGYPAGYLLAALVYAFLFPLIGWRGMFMIGVLPALLVFYIRRHVPESPAFQSGVARSSGGFADLARHWRLGLYAVALGAFLLQFLVQGAWGVIPVHLNELSPEEVRGTFPGFVYQPGNLLASVNATLQANLASRWGGNYGLALALVASVVALLITLITLLGREARGVTFGGLREPALAGARGGE